MIDHCLQYAQQARDAGRPIVGILCEYTPRELLLAAGAVPVCLCGGDIDMIPPAEEHLPAGLCPLIKSTFGYHLTGQNPFLEMADLVVAETTCDGKKKMYELMSAGREMFVLELPQKQSPDALANWTAELRRFRTFLEQRYHTEITDDRLREAIAAVNRYRRLRRSLAQRMVADIPPLTGRELLDAKSLIWCMEEDMVAYEQALASPAALSPQPRLQGRTRVLLTGVPVVHGAEKVVDVIEAAGGVVVCMENCTGLKPILDDVECAGDPLEAIARKYLAVPCSVMMPNAGRLDSLRRLAAEYRVQCVVDLVWQSCLTYDVESAVVRPLVERELGLPYLKIVTDYSPGDVGRIRLRVEALLEMVAARKSRGGS